MPVSANLEKSIVLVAAALTAVACGSEVTSSSSGGGGDAGATATSSSGVGGAGGASSGQGGSAQGGSGGGALLCNPGLVACAMPAPTCPVGEVASVEGGCWGPCVPVLSCQPDASCDGCAGFCAAYEAWTVEYRCVMPTVQCAALACVCLAQYLCVAPYDACVDGDPPNGLDVQCECPTC
jgi:hypothetical protein